MAFFLPYPFAKRFGLNMSQRTTAQSVARQVLRVSPPYSRGRGKVEPAKIFKPGAASVRVEQTGRGAVSVFARTGAFGALSGDVLVGALEFSNGDAYRDFLQGLPANTCNSRSGGWGGYPADRLTRVNDKLSALQASSNGAAQTVVANWEAKARTLIAQVDQFQKFDLGWNPFGCGRSDAREAQYKNALRALTAHLNTMFGMSVPAEPEEPEMEAEDDTAGDMFKLRKPKASQLTKDSGASAGGSGGASKWLLYGLGALVLGGGAYVIMKAK